MNETNSTTVPKQKTEFFSYTDAFISFAIIIVEHFVLAWLDLSTATYLTILGATILAIVSAKVFWRILTR